MVAGMAPIEKVVFTSQDEVTAALINGEIDAMLADSPVTGFAIKLSQGSWSRRGTCSIRRRTVGRWRRAQRWRSRCRRWSD